MRNGRIVGLALLVAGCTHLDGGESDVRGELETEIPPEYMEGKLLSDLTPEIVAKLRAILAAGDGEDASFIKVGDSITEATEFATCLATTRVTDPDLEATRTAFQAAAWRRRSVAAKVGWHTWQPVTGDPTPLSNEIAAMRPSFAIVMLGTNDIYEGTQPSYERNLTKVVDAIKARGIVPILSTIPPIRDASLNAVVPKMNAIVRRVAAGSSIPLMDYHLTLKDLPRYGLAGDGVHPATASTGACDFSMNALRAGYNQRNLLALKALDHVRRGVSGQP